MECTEQEEHMVSCFSFHQRPLIPTQGCCWLPFFLKVFLKYEDMLLSESFIGALAGFVWLSEAVIVFTQDKVSLK